MEATDVGVSEGSEAPLESQETESAEPSQSSQVNRAKAAEQAQKRQEEEVDVDQVLREYQKYRAGDKKLEEASKREKLQAQWLESVKQNPYKVFEDLELNAEEWAEQLLLKKIEYEMMSPEGKDAHAARKELARIKAEKERAEREIEEFKQRASKDQFEQLSLNYSKELNEAIPEFYKKIGKTPTPERLANALEHMIAHVEAHGEVPDIKEVLQHYEGRFDASVKSHLTKLPVQELVSYLSNEQLDGIRKYQLDELRQQNPLRSKTLDRTEKQPVSRRPKPQSTDSFFKKLDKRFA
jgi:hypothetical protein